MRFQPFERALIETALKHTAGRKRDAANLLGWGRNTLTRKLKELGMSDSADNGGIVLRYREAKRFSFER